MKKNIQKTHSKENDSTVSTTTSRRFDLYKYDSSFVRDFVDGLDEFKGVFLSKDAQNDLEKLGIDEIAHTFINQVLWKHIHLTESGLHRIIDTECGTKQGVYIDVADGCDVSIIYEQTSRNTARCIHIHVGSNSSVQLDNIAKTSGTFFLWRYAFVEEGGFFTERKLFMEKEGVFSSNSTTVLRGIRACSSVGTAFIISGKSYSQVYDNIIHTSQNTKSMVQMRGLVYDDAMLVFKGNNNIKRNSFGSSTSCSIAELLCSDKAKGYAIPELVVDSDNCIGGHSATITPIEQEYILYATSRGYSDLQARLLFRKSFLMRTFQDFQNDFSNLPNTFIDAII